MGPGARKLIVPPPCDSNTPQEDVGGMLSRFDLGEERLLDTLVARDQSDRGRHSKGRRIAMRHDLSISGREVFQVLVEFAWEWWPQARPFGARSSVYVEGFLDYVLQGRAPVTLKAGEMLSSRPEHPRGEERRPARLRWIVDPASGILAYQLNEPSQPAPFKTRVSDE